MRTLNCPHCQRGILDNGSLAGRTVSCPHCGSRVTIPPPSAPKPLPMPPPAIQIQPTSRSPSIARTSKPAAPTHVYFVAAGVLVLLLVVTSVVAFVAGRGSSKSTADYAASSVQSARGTAQVAQTDQRQQGSQPHVVRKPASPTAGHNAGDPKSPPQGRDGADDDGADHQGSNVLSPEELYERIAPAVVQLEVKDREGKTLGSGTGFYIDGSGTLITNAHVALANGAVTVVVKQLDGVTRTVDEVVAVGNEWDLAILKVGARSPAFVPLSIESPKVGARVFAVGNPLGLTRSLSEGLISGVRPIDDDHSWVQTTAAISPGSSGGPLIDVTGNVVGVTTSQIVVGESLNFAVPVSAVRQLLDNLQRPQKIAERSAIGTTASGASAGASDKIIRVTPTETLIGLGSATPCL